MDYLSSYNAAASLLEQSRLYSSYHRHHNLSALPRSDNESRSAMTAGRTTSGAYLATMLGRRDVSDPNIGINTMTRPLDLSVKSDAQTPDTIVEKQQNLHRLQSSNYSFNGVTPSYDSLLMPYSNYFNGAMISSSMNPIHGSGDNRLSETFVDSAATTSCQQPPLPSSFYSAEYERHLAKFMSLSSMTNSSNNKQSLQLVKKSSTSNQYFDTIYLPNPPQIINNNLIPPPLSSQFFGLTPVYHHHHHQVHHHHQHHLKNDVSSTAPCSCCTLPNPPFLLPSLSSCACCSSSTPHYGLSSLSSVPNLFSAHYPHPLGMSQMPLLTPHLTSSSSSVLMPDKPLISVSPKLTCDPVTSLPTATIGKQMESSYNSNFNLTRTNDEYRPALDGGHTVKSPKRHSPISSSIPQASQRSLGPQVRNGNAKMTSPSSLSSSSSSKVASSFSQSNTRWDFKEGIVSDFAKMWDTRVNNGGCQQPNETSTVAVTLIPRKNDDVRELRLPPSSPLEGQSPINVYVENKCPVPSATQWSPVITAGASKSNSQVLKEKRLQSKSKKNKSNFNLIASNGGCSEKLLMEQRHLTSPSNGHQSNIKTENNLSLPRPSPLPSPPERLPPVALCDYDNIMTINKRSIIPLTSNSSSSSPEELKIKLETDDRMNDASPLPTTDIICKSRENKRKSTFRKKSRKTPDVITTNVFNHFNRKRPFINDRDVNADSDRLCVNDETILHKAVKSGRLEDADTDWLVNIDRKSIDQIDHDGYTALHKCCAVNGNLELARLLLKHGADVHAKGPRGIQPIHVAITSGNNLEIVRLLLSYGADPLASFDGLTPVNMVRSESMAQFLQDHLADVNGEFDESVLPWQFHGSASFLDPLQSGYNVLNDEELSTDLNDDCPKAIEPKSATVREPSVNKSGLCSVNSLVAYKPPAAAVVTKSRLPRKRSINGRSGLSSSQLVFEVSDKPHITTYRVPASHTGKGSSGIIVCHLNDVLNHTGMNRDAFLACYPNIQVLTMSRLDFVKTAASRQLLVDVKTSTNATSSLDNYLIELLQWNDTLRDILDIDIETVPF